MNPRMRTSKNLTIVTIVAVFTCYCLKASGDEPVSFNSDIRPILSEFCFACHGPDEEDRAADLRLDLREPALAYGALVEGQPDESLLIEHESEPLLVSHDRNSSSAEAYRYRDYEEPKEKKCCCTIS